MQKIVRRFSDRITTQHDVDNTLLRGSNPNFLRTWSLRRKPKSPSFRESTSASSFIDPGHPPTSCPDRPPGLPPTSDRPPGLPPGPGRHKPKAAPHWATESPCVKYMEPVDISSLSSNEHLDHRNGTLPKRRNSPHRLSTELTMLSHDKELNDAMETGFKTNFLCLKTEKQALNEQPEYPTVVSMISCLVLTSLRSRFLQGGCKR